MEALTLKACAEFIPLVGNNGFGPDSPDELLVEFGEALKLAKDIGRPVLIGGHAGLYDPLVRPNGSWLLLPQLPSRELVEFDQQLSDRQMTDILRRS